MIESDHHHHLTFALSPLSERGELAGAQSRDYAVIGDGRIIALVARDDRLGNCLAAPNLDLSFARTDVERRLRRRRRPLHDVPVKAEGAAVTGAGDRVVVQLPFVERAAAM